jgi:hypothetical protein
MFQIFLKIHVRRHVLIGKFTHLDPSLVHIEISKKTVDRGSSTNLLLVNYSDYFGYVIII